MVKEGEKFKFNTDFQQSLLQYIATDKHGYKALQLVNDFYFTLLEHQIIAKALIVFFAKKKRVGSKVTIKEEIRKLYTTRDFANALSPQDKRLVNKTLKKVYNSVKDGDAILEACIKFKRFVETKEVLENADVNNYNEYDTLTRKLQKSTTIGDEFENHIGLWLIKDIKDRQISRKIDSPTNPTPYRQVNRWLNNGGLTNASLVCLLGPSKRFKTGALVNIAKGYMRLRKKILLIDLENGEVALGDRFEQSIMNKTVEEIYSGEFDSHVQKQFRKFKRLGAEVVIKRFPAYSTTFNTVQAFIDDIYREYGIRFDVGLFDYLDLMGAISGKKDETERISDVYVDAKNFLEYNNMDSGWTGSHLNREGAKKEPTKYKANDIAKALDKIRHADAIWGLNQSEAEREAGIMRFQVVDQRQGIPDGRALFWIDIPHQRLTEFTLEQIRRYEEQQQEEHLDQGGADI